MTRQLLPIAALLLGSAFLLLAGGINGLILPVRGAAEGFSSISLGLLGTSWALGYILGCLYVPQLVARVGHVRSFSVMAALATLSVLGSLMMIAPEAWIPLRAMIGFCFAGAAMIVESWLNERTEASQRGRVFGVYTMVNLGANTAGQMLLIFGSADGYAMFVIAAMFYSLALVPTAVSSSSTPQPLVQPRIDLKALWRNSPLAVVGVVFVGVSNSTFGTLAAVYASRIGLEIAAIALFNAIPILAGAAAQMPVGVLSDKVDRRHVLIGVTVLAMCADLMFLFIASDSVPVVLALGAIFGTAVYTMYPVIVAHANDHAAPGTFIQTSGGLLLLFGTGSVIGPLVAGVAMSAIGPRGLFVTTLAAHIAILGYAVWRIGRRAALPRTEKSVFVPAPPARNSTPQTATLAPDIETVEPSGPPARS